MPDLLAFCAGGINALKQRLHKEARNHIHRQSRFELIILEDLDYSRMEVVCLVKVWDCAYSPTGQHLATVAEDGFIYCYSIPKI